MLYVCNADGGTRRSQGSGASVNHNVLRQGHEDASDPARLKWVTWQHLLSTGSTACFPQCMQNQHHSLMCVTKRNFTSHYERLSAGLYT